MTTTIRKLLIANRGEIARRVQRTAHAMGIATVAVFSDADASAPFVREADEAVRIGPPPARESYLVVENLIAACKRTGADALHPGYGFLSERAELAEACAAAGVTFVGPSPHAIRAMGLKREAKELAAKLGVPVVPGWAGSEQGVSAIAAAARGVGYPLLLKASAGGGGKGMRLVTRDEELEHAIESAQREALSAFGDATLLVEKYLERPRHVEVQILGDAHGNVVHLFERECSIQRRHQKIVEESPSPAITHARREQMGHAAVTIARAIGYTSAGTVEMVLDASGSFYFLEVNTRLQVEHAVTELVTGIDLVREQLRIAEGHRLSFSQEELMQHGHAIEVRLYAEDSGAGFLPQTGTLLDWHVPEREGVRLDSGVEAGSEASIHYDPMLAKVIAHGDTRDEAARRLARWLRDASVLGVTTNQAILARILEHPAFLSGDLDTHFLGHHFKDALGEPADAARDLDAAIAATIALYIDLDAGRAVIPGVPLGFRNNAAAPESIAFDVHGATLALDVVPHGARVFEIGPAGGPRAAMRVVSRDGAALSLEDGEGHVRRFRVVRETDRATDHVKHHVHGPRGSVVLAEQPRFPRHDADEVHGGCVAPMPGKVVKVLVAEGDVVEKGARLVLLEAMKMEHAVTAPAAGKVESVRAKEGQQVDAGALLVVIAD